MDRARRMPLAEAITLGLVATGAVSIAVAALTRDTEGLV